jgi:flagellar biosynthesis protein FliR
VTPPGLEGLEQQLLLWLLAAIRPGAAFLTAPVFGAPSVPVQLRLIIALAIGIPAASLSGLTMPEAGLASVAGVMLITSEVLLGLAMGFAVQIGFSAALLGGEAISNAMGLGFASMIDPVGGQSSAAVSQFLSMLATFLFLAIGGHLILAGIIVDSFRALPPGDAWLSAQSIGGMIEFGGLIFSAGLAVALPVGFAMLLVQVVMAMIARATPSLNLIAVGLPVALMAGIILMVIALPVMGDAIMVAIRAGLEEAARIARGG